MRGVAILLVLVGHADGRVAPLAAAGVALFFVLSGYLITGILLDEHARHGRIQLRQFYARRFSRLAPPLLVMLVVMGLLLHAGWQRLLPAMLWVTNYAGHLGADVEPFGHTWSLAVEEQFYLIWPLALLALLRLRGWRAPAVLFGVMLTLLAWRVLLNATGYLDYSYSALETAGVPILGGCLIALTRWRLPANRAAVYLAATGATAIGVSVVNPQLWIATPVMVLPVAMAGVAAADGARWLAWKPLGLCGLASYSLYLWHKPVSWLLDGGLTPGGVAVGSLVGLVAYRVVEAPIMEWRRRGRSRPGETEAPAAARRSEAAGETRTEGSGEVLST